jgi:hypothetical protein
MPTSCHRLELENSPSARLAAVLVEEPRVGGALLVGGGINEANRADTWRFDGTLWTKVSSQKESPNVMNAVATPVGGGVVLFGSAYWHQSVGKREPGQTWIWEGRQWEQVGVDVGGPSARFHSSMAYYPPQNSAILFGGGSAPLGMGEVYNDTWTWSGDRWRQLDPRESPPGRVGSLLYWDSQLEGLVLLGGSDGLRVLDDIWLFRSGEWSRRDSDGTALPGVLGGWAVDPVSRLVAWYGGTPRNREERSRSEATELWIWDGESWYQELLSDGPGRRTLPMMSYVAATREVILYGGVSHDPCGDTWRLTLRR